MLACLRLLDQAQRLTFQIDKKCADAIEPLRAEDLVQPHLLDEIT